MSKSKKTMIAAGKIKGTISKKTRAVELIQEAAEHMKDARKFLLDWDKVKKEDLSETTDKIDEINETLIDMIGELGSSASDVGGDVEEDDSGEGEGDEVEDDNDEGEDEDNEEE